MYNDLFDLVDEMFSLPSVSDAAVKHYPTPSFPKTNVFVDVDGTMTFSFALAGYKKDDLKIGFDENKLLLSTVDDFKSPEVNEKVKVLTNNIKMVPFKYSYFVPETKYKFADTTAKFEDGILTISIPPVEKKERPTITIA